MAADFDIAIIGSGFGGSLLAMVARRLGLRVVMLERGTHPRFAVGESTSPLMNLLIEELAHEYDLPRLLPLTTYGAWQRAYPEVGCGLKRGFTFYAHEAGKLYRACPDRTNQLMVAASPNDEVADTHWLRADVDMFLMREAVALGAEYVDRAEITEVTGLDSGRAHLAGSREGRPLRISAEFVVDATGPRGLLSRLLELREEPFAGYPPTQTLFSHFADVTRCETTPAFSAPGTPPYPADDAAVHHVFDGGWMWVLRVGRGVVSAGFTATDALAEELGLAEGAPAWDRFLRRFPSIGEQFEGVELLRPFVTSRRMPYRCAGPTSGAGWALLPSAAAFIDPLFSTGMPLTLLGIHRLGKIFRECWGTGGMAERLAEYSQVSAEEAEWVALYIGACYRVLPRFELFAPMSMFYFAAASFSEMARRVQLDPAVKRYLAADHPEYAAGLRRCAALEGVDGARLTREVADAISCINIAGLCDPAKRNWYGMDWDDVLTGAEKLGYTRDELWNVIREAPWAVGALS